MWTQKVTGGGIDALAYSSDGRTLFALDGIGRISAWDVSVRTAKPVLRLEAAHRGSVSRLLLTAADRYLIALRFGASTAYLVATGEQHSSGWVAWPKEVRLIPGGGARLALPGRDQQGCFCWDLATDQTGELSVPGAPTGVRVASFDFAPDGSSTAFLDETGAVTLADAASGEVLHRITVPKRAPYLTHVEFAPDGNTLLLFTDHQVVLWDIPRGAVRAETHVPNLFNSTFALNPTLPVFAALDRERVLTLYSLDTGKPLRSLDFALGRFVRCVAFAPDGLTCAVGGSNKQFAVFDVDI